MPKRELSKCREWERERRERLKTCFDALARLLPSHDPTLTPSKLEILQRAATHITDLQQKNKELLLGDQRSTAVAQRDEVRKLRDRVKKLNSRTEQLVNLLRTAGLKIPKECAVFKGPPRLWSGRLSREKAETLRKQHENDQKPSSETPLKHKRKRLSSQNKKSTENTPPPVKKSSPTLPNPKKPSRKQRNQSRGFITSSTTSSASLASKVATVLGPGTLILANGSVVPVPPPATLHRIQLVPAVNTTNPQVILMPQQSKLPTLRPKTNLKPVVAAKIAIPSLTKRKICTKKLKSTSKTAVATSSKDSGAATSVITTDNTKQTVSEAKNTPSDKSDDLNTNTEKVTENIVTKDDSKIETEVLKIEEAPKKDETPKDKDPEPSEPTKPQDPPPAAPNPLLELPSDPAPPEHLSHHSELSNDIFASLGGPGDSAGVIGGQHTESMSPTAAFLLAFPLVSTLTGSRISDPQNGVSGNGGGGSMINSSASSGNNNNSEREDDRQSTPTTLLQIGGTMNLDNTNKPSSRVLQIGDSITIDNNKNNSRSVLNQITDTINLDTRTTNKNVLQQIHVDTNLKQVQQPRNNNYGYFRETQTYTNQQINTYNRQNRENSNFAPNTEKEPLISSVLQVSHACLYEQRNTQQNTNNFYPNLPENVAQNQNYNNNKASSSKNRLKQQNQRAPVNWMTTPDIRATFPPNEPQSTADYFLPPFSDVYSGISSQMTDNQTEQNFSWTSGTNRSVLPTLLGDLALGVTGVNSVNSTNSAVYTNSNKTNHSNQYYPHPFDPNTSTAQNNTLKENSGSFLSVSSILVGGKPRKSHQNHQNQQQSKRHREKSKQRNTSETNSSFEVQNPLKKYGGGYSAEELIGESQYHESRTNSVAANVPSYNLEPPGQQYHHRGQNQLNQNHQNHQQQQPATSRQNQGYQPHSQPQQQPFGGSYPPHGEFSALLSAAVADTYSKTFDSFVHVKPPTESYCNTGTAHNRSHPSDRRHSRRSGAPAAPRDNLAPTTVANTGAGFSDLSFLSMSGAVSSPILQDDFHASAPFLTNAPPPIPTPVASSLTNFNLSAIFPEIHKGAAASTAPPWPHSKPRSQPRYQHQNQQQPDHQHAVGAPPGGGKASAGYCHPQQHSHGQHEGLYGGVAPSQGFPGILGHHQVQGSNADVTAAPTNFSFSFSTP